MPGDDNDDDLLGLDLSAWQPPPPPDTTDAVIARLRDPAPVAAIEVPPPRPRAGWVIGGASGIASAAVAAAVVLALAAAPRDEPALASASGTIAAARPSHLELGGATAELEAGAEIRWQRDGGRIAAAQPRGAATWRVADGDQLVIDAGAAVASVKATGASLRVEVQMHVTEMKMMAASALTSATVALVTVVVYHGHVEATGGGRTVVVPPGSTVEIRPGEPPAAPPSIVDLDHELERVHQRLAQLQAERAALAQRAGAGPLDVTPVGASARTVDHGAVDPCADEAMVARRVAHGDAAYARGAYAAALDDFEAVIACKPSLDIRAYLAACHAKAFDRARHLFAALDPSRQAHYSQACLSQGFDPRIP